MKNSKHYQFWPPRLPKNLTVPETTLYDNLVISAKKYPNKIALYYYGRKISYTELLDEVESLAGYLEKKLEVKQKDNILLFMQNSPQFLISFFAILRLRAVVIPINPMSTTKDLEFYVKDCNSKYALVGKELYEKVVPLKENTSLKEIIVADYSDYVGDDQETFNQKLGTNNVQLTIQDISWKEALNKTYQPEQYNGNHNDVAMIPFTSGTTGKPKGCIHPNKTIQANTVGASLWMNMTADTVSLLTLPLFHVTGLIHSALAPILTGSTVVIMTRWDREEALRNIENYGCSHWINISTMLIDFLSNNNLENYNLTSLQTIGGGGAPLPEAIGEQLYQKLGLKYIEGYGLSETISHTHFNPPHRPKLQCLGIPSFDVDARIIDLSTKEELGPYQKGELIVNGPQVFSGYYNREEENQEAHLNIDGKVFFRTGDIVEMDEEGYFFIVDRLKRMINAAGFKVWPTEVESLLYKHPAVEQACVVSTPDMKRGETVKAFIILKDEFKEKINEDEMIAWSKNQMAAYKYPRIVEFIDTFPTTASGKILWRELQNRS